MDIRALSALFYVVQFDDDLDTAVDRLAQRIESHKVAGFTRDELQALLSAALASDESLAAFDVSGPPRSEETVRQFLRALHQRLASPP